MFSFWFEFLSYSLQQQISSRPTYKLVVLFLIGNAIGDAISGIHKDLPENSLLTTMNENADEVHSHKDEDIRAKLEGEKFESFILWDLLGNQDS